MQLPTPFIIMVHNKKKLPRKNNKKKNKGNKKSSPTSATAPVNSSSSFYRGDGERVDENVEDCYISEDDQSESDQHCDEPPQPRRTGPSGPPLPPPKDMSSWSDPALLRFRIGTKVECNTKHGWLLGEVIKINYREDDWDHYVPYQIELCDNKYKWGGLGACIYAPEDHDHVIRESSFSLSGHARTTHWQRRRKKPCQQQIFQTTTDRSSTTNTHPN